MGCPSGRGACRRHGRNRDAFAAYAEEHGGAVTKEPILPHIARGHLQTRVDVVIRVVQATGSMLVDVTIVSPFAQEMLRSGVLHERPEP